MRPPRRRSRRRWPGLSPRQPRPRRPSRHPAFHPREHDQLVARRSRPEIAPGPQQQHPRGSEKHSGTPLELSEHSRSMLERQGGMPPTISTVRRAIPIQVMPPAWFAASLLDAASLPVTEFSSLPRRLPDRDCRRAVTCTAIAQCGTRGKVPGKRLRNASKPLDLGQLSDIPEDFSEQRPNVRCFKSCREIQFNVILP